MIPKVNVQDNSGILDQDRLASLPHYDVVDTSQEEAFDCITRLAHRIFQMPISAIALVDGHRAWCKSTQGILPSSEVARELSFCAAAITKEVPLIVQDTLLDERFKNHPFVVGEPRIRFYAGAPLVTPGGQNIGALCVVDEKPHAFGPEQIDVLTDLARIVVSELELRTLATTDGLTGAMSRRAFMEEAGRALALAIRHRHSLTCISFDMDHLEAINDANGHALGDQVLAASTELCRTLLRKSDLVGRVGGDKFAVLLPHTDAIRAFDVAEKLRIGMEQKSVSGPSQPIYFSASFGLASLERSVFEIETLLQRADDALYNAKAQGRNRSLAWHAVETVPQGQLRRVFKAGRIAFNGGQSVIDCIVRGMSEKGASLDVISTAGVPSVFKLRIDADNISRACRVLAKRDRHIDVEFA